MDYGSGGDARDRPVLTTSHNPVTLSQNIHMGFYSSCTSRDAVESDICVEVRKDTPLKLWVSPGLLFASRIILDEADNGMR